MILTVVSALHQASQIQTYQVKFTRFQANMNGKLLIAVFGLVVAANLVSCDYGLTAKELRDLLTGPYTESLMKVCRKPSPVLDKESIDEAYTNIFRVYYSDPEMLRRALHNYGNFENGIKNKENMEALLQKHTGMVCGVFESYFEMLEKIGA